MSNNEKPDPDQSPDGAPKKKAPRPKSWSRREVPRPPPICKIIDKAFASPAVIKEQGEARQGTVFEAITMMLERESAKGKPSAQKALRAYEAYAAARPKIRVEPDMTEERAAEIYAAYCRGGVLPGEKPRKPTKAEIARFEEMKNLTEEEAYELSQRSIRRGRHG